MIVQRLREIQNTHGYLPDVELVKLSQEIKAPLYRLQEVASFFPHFRQQWSPPPYVEIKVCRDMSCHLAGAGNLLHAEKGFKRFVREGLQPVALEGTSCLGRCDRAPAFCVSRHDHHNHKKSFHERVYAGMDGKDIVKFLESVINGDDVPDTSSIPRIVDTGEWEIDVYARDPALFEKPYTITKQFLKDHPDPITIPEDVRKDMGKKLPEFIKTKHPWLFKMSQSHLLGMGGAGVKAFEKWRDVWSEREEIKYIIANGDESEPGTFKDRELLLRTPHLVVEGVIMAGLLSNATRGFIYIRHEYHEQIEAVRKEILRARTMGVCGSNLLGTRHSFDLEVFESPGGYICGEQSALIEAMENKRGQPRNKPPEIQANGYDGKPTVVNNVETLSWAPAVLHRAPEWYNTVGRPHARGRRFFSISGDLNKSGVFEVPIGITMGELVELAGGLRGGTLKAIAPSGPSGGFIPARLPVKGDVRRALKGALASARDPIDAELLEAFVTKHVLKGDGQVDSVAFTDFPLELNFFRGISRIIGLNNVQIMLGAGIVVYNSTRNMLEQARNCMQFFRNESCGKCVPCRIGSQKLVEIGTALVKERLPQFTLEDEDKNPPALSDAVRKNLTGCLDDMANLMGQTSICALGASAPNPLHTALQFFPEDCKGRA